MDVVDDVENYRPVSGMAVAAAIVGCLSGLTIFSPIFWFIPLLGVIVSVIALCDLAKPGVVKVGRLAGIAGLALSIGFACEAISTRLVARQIMTSRATRAAEIWLEAIREGRFLDARGMMSPSILPPPEYLGDHEDARAVNDPANHEAAFRKLVFVEAIGGCGKSAADVRCTGYKPESQESKEKWSARIKITPCNDKDALTVDLQLQPTLRVVPAGRIERWEVTKVEVVGPEESRP